MKIGFHPYTYVRTNVMRSKLLAEEDYQRLIKMSVPEITKYLQSRHYAEEINALGAVHSSTELLEQALMNNLNRAFQKLKRITQGNLIVLVNAYLRRFDVENVKTVLRGVKTEQRDEAKKLLFDTGTKPVSFYEHALSQPSLDDALDVLNVLDIVDVADELVVVENNLDKNYYEDLLDTCVDVDNAELFEEFIREEILMTNVLNVLRLTKEGMEADDIRSLLIPGEDLTTDLIGLDLDDLIEALEDTKFTDLISSFDPHESLIPLERELQRYLLRKSRLFLHQDMLSINVILGFMFAKELEVRNLRTLVKGKQLGIDQDFIKEELIV